MRDLLKAGAPKDTINEMGLQAVHCAAKGGHIEALKLLKESECDLTTRTPQGATTLHCAAEGGHVAAVQWLLEHSGLSLDSLNSDGDTALDVARKNGHHNTTGHLQEAKHQRDLKKLQDEKEHEITRLAAELKMNELEKAKHQRDLKKLQDEKEHEITRLAAELKINELEKAKHQRDLKKLQEEMKEKEHEITRLAAELKMKEELEKGAGSKDEEAVRKPLDHRANPERPGDLEGEKGSPDLHTAASVGHVNVMRDLLKAGAPKDTINEMGLQAVHCAAKGGHIEALKLLKESECDLTTRTPQGATTLHCAAEGGHVAAVQWLLEHSGLSLDSLNSDGDTALDVARKNGHHNTTGHLQETKHQRDLKKLQEEMKEKEHEITRLAAELKMKEELEKEEIKKLQAMLKSKDEQIKRLSKKQRKGKHQRESKKMDSPE
ncbi:ankyrin-3-like isoform X4 [Penaeus indicus]|uniref:ankyrin-3-like isoform X4 n=1 Tax=Penaeus indicus TaxID=29960 RepID=UPI00300D9EFE